VEDRDPITELIRENLDLPVGSAAIEPSFQDWKYWRPHPLFAGSRGYVLHDNGRIVSHGCRWPIRVRAASGDLDSCHLIDWVADRNAPGSGMKVLHDCVDGLAAVFSIGGSAMGQRVASAFGFKPTNPVWLMTRPLHLLNPAWRDSARDWRFPLRLARNGLWNFLPRMRLKPGWMYEPVPLSGIPEALFPLGTANEAVSMRDARLLAHIATCPRFQRVQAYMVNEISRPVAYFVLGQVGHEVRLIDFGPAGLHTAEAQMLGVSAQQAARADFPGAAAIATTTTEPAVRVGLLSSGFRDHRQKTIRVLPLKPEIRAIAKFRLTMIDWDIACL